VRHRACGFIFNPGSEHTDVFFACLQSLLAALGSVQFVSNVVFAYLVLKETVTERYAFSFTNLEMLQNFSSNNVHQYLIPFLMGSVAHVSRRTLYATVFIVVGNVFLVSFGNHQSASKPLIILLHLSVP
jgi:drug/metabolite transporter (DMT)-like permease